MTCLDLSAGYNELKIPGKVLLLAGDPKMKTLKWDKGNDTAELYQRKLFGLRCILHQLARENKADIVLVDMGPASSELSQFLLHTVDAVLPSFSPDYNGWASYCHLAQAGQY